MARAARLLDLLQALRSRRHPVTAQTLAEETGVSVRTLYRDIEALRALGAPIDGEGGVGYVLKRGFLMPPLMLTQDEAAALALGARWVTRIGDPDLAAAAKSLLAKAAALAEPGRLDEIELASLMAPALDTPERADVRQALKPIRAALRSGAKVAFDYSDAKGTQTRRVVWPVLVGFFDSAPLLAAWCEARSAFRHFRLDRMRDARALDERAPTPRRTLIAQWREAEGVDLTPDMF